MREFVFGTEQQYRMLKDSLNDNMCHVYKNCELPRCCDRDRGRIGFEKEGSTYALFIDKGITCRTNGVPSLFREWLGAGVIRFLEFTDMKEFLRSLSSLYR